MFVCRDTILRVSGANAFPPCIVRDTKYRASTNNSIVCVLTDNLQITDNMYIFVAHEDSRLYIYQERGKK